MGQSWTLAYPLPATHWVYPVESSSPISTDHLSIIGQSLVEDVKTTYLQEPEDPYTVGKALARLGTLALLADNLGTRLVCCTQFIILTSHMMYLFSDFCAEMLLYQCTVCM